MRKFSVFLLTAVLALMHQSAFAATDFKITVMSDTITGSCDDSTYYIQWSWFNTVDDGEGYDLATMIATDEDARAIASDWSGDDPGLTYVRTTYIGAANGINSIVPGKDITVEVFDSVFPHPDFGANFQSQYDDIAARPEPVALSLTFNPGNCDQELMVSTERSAPVPALGNIGLIGLLAGLLLVGGMSIHRRLS